MHKSLVRVLGTTAAFAVAGLLAACNDSPCTDNSVLAKVKELFDKQQFGQFIEAPPNVFVIQTKTATEVSTDKDSTKKRCSVIITSDIIEMMRFTKQASEDEIAKIKVEAPKKGFALTKDDLVNFTVQPLANGQNYVTVLP
jgi:hypothetical protein